MRHPVIFEFLLPAVEAAKVTSICYANERTISQYCRSGHRIIDIILAGELLYFDLFGTAIGNSERQHVVAISRKPYGIACLSNAGDISCLIERVESHALKIASVITRNAPVQMSKPNVAIRIFEHSPYSSRSQSVAGTEAFEALPVES